MLHCLMSRSGYQLIKPDFLAQQTEGVLLLQHEETELLDNLIIQAERTGPCSKDKSSAQLHAQQTGRSCVFLSVDKVAQNLPEGVLPS
jgi:hypothetical protein